MTEPRDGLPTNLSQQTRALLAELADRRRLIGDPKPVLVLRRRTCGCLLGSVYRLPSGALLVGLRRGLVQGTETRADARLQEVALALSEMPFDFSNGDLACKHGSPTFDMGKMLAALKDSDSENSVLVL